MKFNMHALLIVSVLGIGFVAAEAPADAQGLPAITAMTGTGELAPPTDPEHFTFVVFGDNRPGKGEPQPDTIKEIFAEIRELEPAPGFAVSLGDIIKGKDPEDSKKHIKAQFDDFLALAKKAGVPIFNAPGNHEMDDDNDVPSERMQKIYEECVSPSYGAFNYGNSRFICLNTENVPPEGTPPPKPPLEFSYMSDQQLAELAADLEANKDKAHIFIAMHYPIKPKKPDASLNPEDLKQLVDLFGKYDNISYVLAAHEHLYFNPQDPDNVTDAPGFTSGGKTVHLISGGAGAPMKGDNKWEFHHYLIFKVDGGEVSVTLVKLDSKGAKS